MTTHTIKAHVIIRDSDDNELARDTMTLTVKFTLGYEADETDPGCGDFVELYAAPILLPWSDAARTYVNAHHDEIAAQCRADLALDPDRMREEAQEMGRV